MAISGIRCHFWGIYFYIPLFWVQFFGHVPIPLGSYFYFPKEKAHLKFWSVLSPRNTMCNYTANSISHMTSNSTSVKTEFHLPFCDFPACKNIVKFKVHEKLKEKHTQSHNSNRVKLKVHKYTCTGKNAERQRI